MSLITPLATSCQSTVACDVISPASTTSPVVQSVSAATRAVGSCASTASRTASDIWSATLSGWPSPTDSEVKKWLSLMDRVTPSMVSGCDDERARAFVDLEAAGPDGFQPVNGLHDAAEREE